MKIIILAGGFGTRISEYTKTIPKPMVKIGGTPILEHIMNHYIKWGYNEFYVATGYKSEIIKKHFKNFKKYGIFFNHTIYKKKCKINLVKTGLNTFTGGRLKKLKFFFKKGENFMFTYGDGISNVNIKSLVKFHNLKNRTITVTAVRPPARFGEIILKNNRVVSFKEKPQTNNGWINGGFFVANYEFFNFIKGNRTILEKEPLEKAVKKKQLIAYKHKGFWKCMDTVRDKNVLEKIFKENKFSWK